MDKLVKFIKEHIYVILVSLLLLIAIILLIVLIKDELITLLSILFLLILLILMSQINIKNNDKSFNIIKEESKKDSTLIPTKPIKEEKDKKEELVNVKDNNKEKIDDKEKEKLKKELKEEIRNEFLKEQKNNEDNKPKEEKHNLIDSIKKEIKETTNNQSFDIKEDKNNKDIREIIKDNEIIKEIENKIKPNKIENLDVNNDTKKRIVENNIKKEKTTEKENLKVTPTTFVPPFITNFISKKNIRVTEEEKIVAAYIQDLINNNDQKEVLDFYKDEEGYINVHLNTDFLKFKIDKNEKYFIIPSSINVPLETKPHNEKDKKKALFNDIEDLDLIKDYIKNEYNKDKLKKKVLPKKGKHFKLHPIEIKEIINKEKERIKKKRINKKIEYYINIADKYHKEHKYENEISVLEGAIESLQNEDIDLSIIKKKLSVAYQSIERKRKEKEKIKVKEKLMKE